MPQFLPVAAAIGAIGTTVGAVASIANTFKGNKQQNQPSSPIGLGDNPISSLPGPDFNAQLPTPQLQAFQAPQGNPYQFDMGQQQPLNLPNFMSQFRG